jgi:predicted DNA-binding protein (MmcQ/YjbR family)
MTSPPRKRSETRAARRGGATVQAVNRLRTICLALPDTTEKIAWGEPTWRVRGRLFAQLDNHHHGADHLAVWLPAPLGEQEAMIFTDPVRFFRPPYVGSRGWVGVRIDRRPNWTVVAKLVKQAYRLVAPRRASSPGIAASRPCPTSRSQPESPFGAAPCSRRVPL